MLTFILDYAIYDFVKNKIKPKNLKRGFIITEIAFLMIFVIIIGPLPQILKLEFENIIRNTVITIAVSTIFGFIWSSFVYKFIISKDR